MSTDSSSDQVNSLYEALVKPYRDSMAQEMDEIIGYTSTTLVKERPESSLGNWMVDAMHEMAEAEIEDLDFTVLNYGGIRLGSIEKGAVTRSMIYELMPFDNYLVVVSLEGEVVKKLFDKIALYNGWPVSRGVTLEMQNKQAVNIKIQGDLLDENKIYRVGLSNYIANGGDRCDFLKPYEQTDIDLFIRDALIDYVKQANAKGQKISASKEGRVK